MTYRKLFARSNQITNQVTNNFLYNQPVIWPSNYLSDLLGNYLDIALNKIPCILSLGV